MQLVIVGPVPLPEKDRYRGESLEANVEFATSIVDAVPQIAAASTDARLPENKEFITSTILLFPQMAPPRLVMEFPRY
jgi:hypothetical protein